MIDYHQSLRSALQNVLPTHYEMTLHSGLSVPCISYMELSNISLTEAVDNATVGYSRITYQVKVWANDIGTIQKYAIEVDKVLRPLGFKRVSASELYDNNSTMIQKIMTYEALGFEEL